MGCAVINNEVDDYLQITQHKLEVVINCGLILDILAPLLISIAKRIYVTNRKSLGKKML